MLLHRGLDRGSVLVGKSTHNQRIERFWRDCTKEVVDFYRTLFNELEHHYFGNSNSPMYIFVLHYLFIGRINDDLRQFQLSWNRHALSTEHNRTPNQLLILNGDRSDALQIPTTVEIPDEPIVGELQLDNLPKVQLEPINCPLNAFQYDVFRKAVDPISI